MPQKPDSSRLDSKIGNLFDAAMRRVIYKGVLLQGRKARVAGKNKGGVYTVELYDEETIWWFFKRRTVRSVLFLYQNGECTFFNIVPGTARIVE